MSSEKKLFITIIVIVIIATIFTLVRIHKADQNYKGQIEKIKTALKAWSAEYEQFLPTKTGETITISLATLKQSGYIEDKFVNPKEKANFSNQLLLKITKDKKEYKYQVLDNDPNMIKDYDEINKSAPMIILKGSEIEYAELNKSYKELGYEAITADGKKADEEKISITSNGKAVRAVDTSTLGTYQITYRIFYAKEDSTITRTVIVRDTEKPEVKMERLDITVEEAKNIDLMKDVEISDNSGKDLKINIIGSVSAVPGKYVITYQVSDKAGNMTEKKRVVRVGETD